ncbi:pentapeptide repeat-containing protein [Lentzea pudingi]|uniref:pentapeptide repeat-containing protein n=1 Tax=Lentzea pudingi TaxID=1789439 RepID=UPI00166EC4BE|nr:pentapeptide repeat-containing protein [Lentzea pudingi]
MASGIALGGGGLFTLYLAARRQRTQEEAQADINADAEARRITELYTKAVQQLGDDKAPVRLGGLYALERLGQQQPDQRQTIVNVLCAYLRMPYTPPPERAARSAKGVHRPLLRNSGRRAGIRRPEGQSPAAGLVDAQQERDVRLTAQRILVAHLKRGGESWGELDINLDGAVLIDFRVSDGLFRAATFRGATFIGDMYFLGIFTGFVSFAGASFVDEANFGGTFRGVTRFSEVFFGGEVAFSGVSFAGYVTSFAGASFAADAIFGETEFVGRTHFRDSAFSGRAGFASAWVGESAIEPGSSWPAGWTVSGEATSRPGRDGHDGQWFRLVRTSSAAPPRPPTARS